MKTMSYSSKTEPSYSYKPKGRLLGIKIIVLLAFTLLGTRLVYVQAILRTDLRLKAGRQLPVQDENRVVRHSIQDRMGRVVAEMNPVSSCYVDPRMIRDRKTTAREISESLGLNAQDLEAKIARTKGSFLWVERNVDPLKMNHLASKKLSGVGFKTEWRRHYPAGEFASHVLGFVGREGTGLSGVEQSFDRVLRGVAGSDGEWPPGDVRLTIDWRIQQIVERELAWGIKKINAKNGAVVVQNPKTGEILAMSYWPPISLNPEAPPNSKELRIPPLIDVFEPGSTFKVVAAAAALEEKLVEPGEKWSGEKGAWKTTGITIHDHEPQGLMTFDEIWMHSSNIGAAKIGQRVGKKKLYQYARLFGFGVFPGSGISGEAKGLLRTPSQWSGVSEFVIAFGQEVGVTAIQIVSAYSAIANGGLLMEPRLVRSITDDEGREVWRAEFDVVRRVISTETSKQLTGILERVVAEGTGQNAQIPWREGCRVAGKTGTAQKYDVADGGYHSHLTLVSFCGFFPSDNPEYTMLVLLDEPEGRRWGGTDAAPVFRRIAEQILTGAEKPAPGA